MLTYKNHNMTFDIEILYIMDVTSLLKNMAGRVVKVPPNKWYPATI